MLTGSSLDALAARWAARPEPGVFAALAEGLAKRGDLDEAGRVVAAGLARYPGHAAGLVAQARIAVAAGDRPLAVRALAVLLERDPGHPLGREMAAAIAPHLIPEDAAAAHSSTGPAPVPASGLPVQEGTAGQEAPSDQSELPEHESAGEQPAIVVELVEEFEEVVTVEFAEPTSDEPLPAGHVPPVDEEPSADGEVDTPPIITESLAALYHRQGHLEEALAAYAELAARDPTNDTVVARHEAVRRELATHRPLPFDARDSGGRSVASWLGAIAAVRPPEGAGEASFDAFYEPPPAPADATADFDAFQRWLQELGR